MRSLSRHQPFVSHIGKIIQGTARLRTWYVSVTSWPDILSCFTSSWLRPTSSGFSFLRMLYKM
jgi:hypothetical protein